MRPLQVLLLALLILGLVMPRPASALKYRFEGDFQLSSSPCWAETNGIGQHQVAIRDGEVFVVWAQCDCRPWFARSEGGGATFTDPIPLGPPTCPVVWPSLACSPGSGVIHVVWEGQTPIYPDWSVVYYTRSTDGGRSFEDPREIGWIPWVGWSCPRVTADNSGNVYVVFVPGFGSIQVARSRDDGETFSEPADIEGVVYPGEFGAPGYWYGPEELEAACAPGGQLVVLYGESIAYTSNAREWLMVSEDGGETFSTPREVNRGQNPTLTFTEDGRLHMGSTRLRWPSIWETWYRDSDDLGTSFREKRLENGAYREGGSLEQEISVAARDSIVAVAWNRQADSTLVVAASSDRGATFDRWGRVTPVPGARNASIALTPEGDAWVVWMDNRSGTPEVYASRGRPVRREPARPALFARSGSAMPALQVSPNPSIGGCIITSAVADAADGSAQGIEIFDVSGRRVRELVLPQSGVPSSGAPLRQVRWDGQDQSGRHVGAGIYFLRLHSAGRETVSRIVLTR
jgi:hypothetical protein